MKSFVDKLRKTPIWVVAILLVVGTVLAAGIWLATVGSPATYGEPFVVEYSDETRFNAEREEGEWENIKDFPYVHQKDPIDLTYNRFHEYIRVQHTGRDPINISMEIIPEGVDNNHQLGFVMIEGFIGPEEISWEEINENRTDDGNTDFREDLRLEENEKEFTIINIYDRNEDLELNSPSIDEDVTIIWNFERHAVGIYNFTPLIIIISIFIAGTITYVIFKDVEVFE